MAVQRIGKIDPWRLLWRLTTGDTSLAVLLLVLAGYLVVLTIVPQAPSGVPPSDQWLSQAEVWFGPVTEPLYRIGLFTITASPLPRLLLVLAAFLLAARGIEQAAALGEKGRSRWPLLFPLLAHVGPLLLLLGLLIGLLTGWRAEDVIGRAGDTLIFPGRQGIVLGESDSATRSASLWVRVHITGYGPQLDIHAWDDEGAPLQLQSNPQDPSRANLSLPLRPGDPEVYFAIPSLNVVVRVAAPPNYPLSADMPLTVQVFRTPTGEVIREESFVGETVRMDLTGGKIELGRSRYLLLTVVYDPGFWLKVAGLVIGGIGMAGGLLWPQQRSRLQWALRGGLALLTLAVASLALRSLLSVGMIWDWSPLQAGVTGVWLALCAVGLLLNPAKEGE